MRHCGAVGRDAPRWCEWGLVAACRPRDILGGGRAQARLSCPRREQPHGLQDSLEVGLDAALDYLEHLHFEADAVEYLRSLHLFDESFLSLLSTLRFTGECARFDSFEDESYGYDHHEAAE